MDKKTTKSYSALEIAIKMLLGAILGLAEAVLFVVMGYFIAWFVLLSGSNVNHGYDLEEFVQNCSGLDYETFAEFNLAGYKIYETTQFDEAKVEHDLALANWARAIGFGKTIQIHSHTLDVPFSDLDLISNAEWKPYCAMVVTPKHVYTLEAPHGWPSSTEVQNFFEPVINDVWTAADEGLVELYPSDELQERACSTDLLIELFAEEFNMTFSATTIEKD